MKRIRRYFPCYVETLAIRNALMKAINSNYLKVIIKSDSLIGIQTIKGEFIPPKIFVIQLIIMLAKKVDNIIFVYCRRFTNELTDRIANETLCACTFKSYR